MCVIIDLPAGASIPSDWLDNAIEHNPHGWGIMAAINGQIRIHRGFSLRSLKRAYNALKANRLTIHLRYATHGGHGLANCHPFELLKGKYAVMHNGIIGTAPMIRDDRSDTWHFAHKVLSPILASRPDWFGSDVLRQTLESIAGDGNKLAIMRHDGQAMLTNEGAWINHGDGIKTSNAYSLKPQWTRSRGFIGTPRHYDSLNRPESQLYDDPVLATDEHHEYRDLESWYDSIVSLDQLQGLSLNDTYEYVLDRPDEAAQLIYDQVNGF